MNLEKTISLVGNLYEADAQTRQTEDQVNMASYGLTRLFEMESVIPAGTTDLNVDFGSATTAELFFARVDVPEGGDCKFELEFAATLSPAAWDAGNTYAAGVLVSFGGRTYASLVGGNIGNATSDNTKWLQLTTAANPTTSTKVMMPCNGGELWLNRTSLKSAKINSTSGCNVQIIGGGRS